MNDFFIDAALGDRRYTLCHLLSSNQFPKPNITILNEAFVAVCRRKNYFVATILSEHISQDAFDEAFHLALEESDQETVHWLLSGRHGFQPSQERLENEYRKIRLSLYQQQYDRPLFRQNYRFVASGMLNRHFRILPLIESRVSSSTKQMIEDEIRAIQRLEQRRNRQRQLFHIQDADIHSYSAATIEPSPDHLDEEGDEMERGEEGERGREEEREANEEEEEEEEIIRPRRRDGKLSLNEVIIANITRRVAQLHDPTASGGGDGTEGEANDEDVDRTMTQLISLIRRYIPLNQQDAAVHLLGDILNNRSAKLFAITLQFLNSDLPLSSSSSSSSSRPSHSQVMEIWIQGFLTESVVMHSCNPGALERVVTGLRGINDFELDQIFAQAEAPQLINIFLKSTFNLFYDDNDDQARDRGKRNSIKLAKELIHRREVSDVSMVSDVKVVQEKLVEYAMDVIKTIDSNHGQRYEEEVLVIVEMVMENYDTHLRGFIEELLMMQEQERDGDGEGEGGEDHDGEEVKEGRMDEDSNKL
jgi:hypothetical protein